MRAVLIGTVRFSGACFETLLDLQEVEVCGVVTQPPGAANSDFASLAPRALAAGIPSLEVSGREDGGVAAFIRSRRADVVLCLGWHRLLGPRVLESTPLGVVGYHPADLPRNRGRHPIIWTLALGLHRTASTFLFLDRGADSGDIIDQRPLPVLDSDDAGNLYRKLTDVAQEQLRMIVPLLAQGRCPRRPQGRGDGNVWRRRTEKDGIIDWRMPGRGIRNLVRALARPYPGAVTLTRQGTARVWRAALEDESGPMNLEPGRVLESGPDGIVVKAGEGSVRLLEHELRDLPPPGTYL